jgi:hypothetical protein
LARCMRLSLMKAAHAILSSAAYRKSGFAPVEMTILFGVEKRLLALLLEDRFYQVSGLVYIDAIQDGELVGE